MIRKFNNFKTLNESNNVAEMQKLVDSILDKINEYGYENLSKLEKEILQKASSDGIESLEEYIDSDDNPVLSFDKHGHILIDGIPYTEWSMNKDKKTKKDNDWEGTTKLKELEGSVNADYKVRVYKNDEHNYYDYILIWVKGESKGNVKKYSSKRNEKNIYGTITLSKSWQNKDINELHKSYFDKEYHKYKDINDEEISLFETLMLLRHKYKKNELTDPKEIENLNKLYNKFNNF